MAYVCATSLIGWLTCGEAVSFLPAGRNWPQALPDSSNLTVKSGRARGNQGREATVQTATGGSTVSVLAEEREKRVRVRSAVAASTPAPHSQILREDTAKSKRKWKGWKEEGTDGQRSY